MNLPRVLLVTALCLTGCNLFGETAPGGGPDASADASNAQKDVGSDAPPDGATAGDASTRDAEPGDTTNPQDLVASDVAVGKDLAAPDLGPDQPVCVPETDVEFCGRISSTCGATNASDNCGTTRDVDCGVCTDPETCQANRCICRAESDADFCTRMGSACGTTGGADNCAMSRDVDCGVCNAPETCQANQCICTPESDTEFCDRLTSDCGTRDAPDNCGVDRSVACGTCTSPAVCGGGGTPNVCACSTQSDAEFCATNGALCGAFTGVDACNLMRSVNCGACNAPDSCGGGGAANQCGCTPETDSALCALAGAGCGMTTATDSCAMSRTIDCGACTVGSCSASLQCGTRFESFPDAMLKSGGTPPTDTITVSGCATIASIIVDIDIAHTYIGDLRIELISPAGTLILLKIEGSGGAADDVIGNYPLTLTPVDSLDLLVGEPGDGTWAMTVSDTYQQDNGTWNSWALNLSCL